jgi:hypothetical protein
MIYSSSVTLPLKSSFNCTIDLSDQAPTKAELGAPIYPGSEYVEGSGGTMTGTGEEGEFATAAAEFTTKDSFNEVVAWYTAELG